MVLRWHTISTHTTDEQSLNYNRKNNENNKKKPKQNPQIQIEVWLCTCLQWFFLNFCFCQLDDKTDAWTELINFHSISDTFNSFNIGIRKNLSQKSFTWNLLEAYNLDKVDGEIRSLARRVVLNRHIKDEDKIPGTVYVYEVIVTYWKQQIYIKEMVICCYFFFFHKYLKDFALLFSIYFE